MCVLQSHFCFSSSRENFGYWDFVILNINFHSIIFSIYKNYYRSLIAPTRRRVISQRGVNEQIHRLYHFIIILPTVLFNIAFQRKKKRVDADRSANIRTLQIRPSRRDRKNSEIYACIVLNLRANKIYRCQFFNLPGAIFARLVTRKF